VLTTYKTTMTQITVGRVFNFFQAAHFTATVSISHPGVSSLLWMTGDIQIRNDTYHGSNGQFFCVADESESV
jgi:hypothetical protein